MTPDLTTRSEYDALRPTQQGFAVYMQGAHSGSELAGLTNPYPEGSQDRKEWSQGQFQGVLAAQDSEE